MIYRLITENKYFYDLLTLINLCFFLFITNLFIFLKKINQFDARIGVKPFIFNVDVIKD